MKKKIIYVVIALFILIGVIVALTVGFNKGSSYGSSVRINVYMSESFEMSEVEEAVNEALEGIDYKISYINGFEDSITISLKSISDDEYSNLVTKLNEEYELSEEDGDIIKINIPKVYTYDMVKGYIKPILISFILVLIYLAFTFRKQGAFDIFFGTCIKTVVVLAIFVSAIAIFRIPMSEYIAPIGTVIYILTLLGITANLRNK